MEYKFIISDLDSDNRKLLKKEFNKLLNISTKSKKEIFDIQRTIMDFIDKINMHRINVYYYPLILNYIKEFLTKNIIGNCPINKNDFINITEYDYFKIYYIQKDLSNNIIQYNTKINKYVPYLYLIDNIIYNRKAYVAKEIARYDIYTMSSEKVFVQNIYDTPIIYFSKGGVITGEYIHLCAIKSENDEYNIPDTIELPVSYIHDSQTDLFLLTIDNRHKKLKELFDLYNVEIKHDNYIKELKLDIRKFKKNTI